MKRTILTGISIAGTLLLAACGTTTTNSGSPSSPMTGHSMSPSMPGMTSMDPPASATGMPGMSMPSSNGLHNSVNGYALKTSGTASPGVPVDTKFTITHAGRAVTAFDPEQTKLMHFYLIRSDLTGFQHLHPTMSPDGTWSVTTRPLSPGSYRIYVQFVPHAAASAGPLVLSAPLMVSGSPRSTPLPAASTSTTVDGYTVTLTGHLKAGVDSMLSLRVTKAGNPVTDLQPYLDTYAHVTAIHAGDLAFAHLHPDGGMVTGPGGPTLTAHAELPEPGKYRMFIQFQTGGILHTAALTVAAS